MKSKAQCKPISTFQADCVSLSTYAEIFSTQEGWRFLFSSFNTYSVPQPMFILSSSSRSKMISPNHKTPMSEEFGGPIPWSESDELICGTWGGPIFQGPRECPLRFGVCQGAPEQQDVGLWLVDHVVNPSLALLDPKVPPLSLRH